MLCPILTWIRKFCKIAACTSQGSVVQIPGCTGMGQDGFQLFHGPAISRPQSLHHGFAGLFLDQCGTSSHRVQNFLHKPPVQLHTFCPSKACDLRNGPQAVLGGVAEEPLDPPAMLPGPAVAEGGANIAKAGAAGMVAVARGGALGGGGVSGGGGGTTGSAEPALRLLPVPVAGAADPPDCGGTIKVLADVAYRCSCSCSCSCCCCRILGAVLLLAPASGPAASVRDGEMVAFMSTGGGRPLGGGGPTCGGGRTGGGGTGHRRPMPDGSGALGGAAALPIKTSSGVLDCHGGCVGCTSRPLSLGLTPGGGGCVKLVECTFAFASCHSKCESLPVGEVEGAAADVALPLLATVDDDAVEAEDVRVFSPGRVFSPSAR